MVHKRDITSVILHCSASGPDTTVGDIRKWHKARGWSDIGYHMVIENNGNLKLGRDVDKEGAHCRGQNKNSIGVCLVGGVDGNGVNHKFNKKQYNTLKIVLVGIFMSYGLLPIHGHNHFNKNKLCPCFDVDKFLKDNGLCKP